MRWHCSAAGSRRSCSGVVAAVDVARPQIGLAHCLNSICAPDGPRLCRPADEILASAVCDEAAPAGRLHRGCADAANVLARVAAGPGVGRHCRHAFVGAGHLALHRSGAAKVRRFRLTH